MEVLNYQVYDDTNQKFVGAITITLPCPKEGVTPEVIEAFRLAIWLSWCFKAFTRDELTAPTTILAEKSGEARLSFSQLMLLLSTHPDVKCELMTAMRHRFDQEPEWWRKTFLHEHNKEGGNKGKI